MTTRVQVLVQGIVQGVGFRPFVYGLAVELGLHGWVRNSSAGVEIVLHGPAQAVEIFIERLQHEAPPLARIDALDRLPSSSAETFTAFHILPSVPLPQGRQALPADAASCPACVEELFQASNRRYLYPFITCTQCGPRFTIMNDLPCDRQNTVMAAFPLCSACQAEYDNPLDRRFHAQATACPQCGPRVTLQAGQEHFTSLTAILQARKLLRQGAVLAVKGLGGFHLVCDAQNAATVEELRRRKQRRDKPFALMAAGCEFISVHCHLCTAAEAALQDGSILLLEKKQGSAALNAVAPTVSRLGIMLPYTPLHHLLLNQEDPVLAREAVPALLVCTSGNRSGQPIIYDNGLAQQDLTPLADALLYHDRPILAPCDDSVACIRSGKMFFFRRSRGHVPRSLRLPQGIQAPAVLALGGQVKNTFCLIQGQEALLSQHFGDLDDLASCAAVEEAIERAIRLFRIQPEYLAHDLHPQYASTRYAQNAGLPCRAVQHHHAHIAACMADNGLENKRVIGLAFDGTGYGRDGAIWGGEVLLASYTDFERFAHLQYLPLPGAEQAIRYPWRIALGYAQSLGLAVEDLPFLTKIKQLDLGLVQQQVKQKLNTPLTSSVGRLFDAVAALLALRTEVHYEGQAAVEMEAIAKPFMASTGPYFQQNEAGPGAIPVKPILEAILADLRSGKALGLIAARFHHSLVQLALALGQQARQDSGLNIIVLSGGVWQNQLLLNLVWNGLNREGFVVYAHKQVPTNDGGLALGQAVVAAAQAMQGKTY